MTKLTVDTAIQKTLEAAVGPVRVYNSDGATIGYFVPLSVGIKATGPTITSEELARREREGEHITTAELLRRMEAR